MTNKTTTKTREINTSGNLSTVGKIELSTKGTVEKPYTPSIKEQRLQFTEQMTNSLVSQHNANQENSILLKSKDDIRKVYENYNVDPLGYYLDDTDTLWRIQVNEGINNVSKFNLSKFAVALLERYPNKSIELNNDKNYKIIKAVSERGDDDIQDLLAKAITRNDIDIPYRAIDFLRNADSTDIEHINKIASLIIHDRLVLGIQAIAKNRKRFTDVMDIYNSLSSFGIDYRYLLDIEDMGLVNIQPSSQVISHNRACLLSSSGEEIYVEFNTPENIEEFEIKLDYLGLTRMGKGLVNLVSQNINPEYLDYIKDKLFTSELEGININITY